MGKIASTAAVLIGAALFPLAVGAEINLKSPGVSLVPPAGNTGAVAESEQASTIRDTRKPGGHTLRCWQYGRLLYEGSGFRHDLERSATTITVPRAEGDPVVVLDLKDAVCMLSKG
jgi:hypothetical protein